MSGWQMKPGEWIDRAPMILRCNVWADGEENDTPIDRRWLWRLSYRLDEIAGNIHTSDDVRQLAEDLKQYLYESCVHVWNHYVPDEGDSIAEHWQCRWCNDVRWAGEEGAPDVPA